MYVDREKFLVDLFSMIGKKYTPVQAKRLATELYETEYGIYNFTNPKSGLNHVAVQPKEEYYRNSVFDNRLRKYLELNISEVLGLDFISFMSLPRFRIDAITRIIGEFNALKDDIQAKVEKEQRLKDEAEERKRNKANKEK